MLSVFIWSCSEHAQKAERDGPTHDEPLFGSVEVIGNEGIESYKISHQSDGVQPDSILADLLDEFGSFDKKPNKNTYVWENFTKKDWHEDPFTLDIYIGVLFQRDGVTPTGLVTITVGTETDDEVQLLKPDTESYNKIVAYFDDLVAKRLHRNDHDEN